MRLTAVIVVNLYRLIVPACGILISPSVPSRLNITTIGAANGKSTLECWQLSAPFVQSSQPGTAGAAIVQLGETGATSYLLLSPQFDGGFHNAPVVQCVLLSLLSNPVKTPFDIPFSAPFYFHLLSEATGI